MMAAAEVAAVTAPMRVLKRKAGYEMEPVANCFAPGEGKILDIRGMDVEMEGLSVTTKKPKVD